MNKQFIPQVIFSDFDGTLTCGSEINSNFLQILETLKINKIPLIIVTGRSISWAHFLLTHFSFLDYIIAEGGGVISRRGKGDEIINEFLVKESEIEELNSFTQNLLSSFAGLKLSADSIGRVSDRAIELDEFNTAQFDKVKIEKLMEKEGINFSTSSVHLNFWKGSLSKYDAVVFLLEKYFPKVEIDKTLFFGDSLNDQSMFKKMNYSVGVANIIDCMDRLEHLPKLILEGDSNNGSAGVLNYLKKSLS